MFLTLLFVSLDAVDRYLFRFDNELTVHIMSKYLHFHLRAFIYKSYIFTFVRLTLEHPSRRPVPTSPS